LGCVGVATWRWYSGFDFCELHDRKENLKTSGEIGKGAIEGVASPEAANNAAAEAGFIPLLTLGIPISPMFALIFAGLMIHGITPGPLLISNNPDVSGVLSASMYIGILCY